MNLDGLGKLLVIAGAAVLVLGIVLVLAGRSSFLSDFLQSGTLRFGGDNFTCLIPVVTSILLSIILTLILNIVIRFLNK